MSDNVTVLTVDDNNLELTMADNAPLLSATADINNPEPTMDNKSPPTFCRMCDAAFPSTAEWRQHMKSDQHVNMLRKQLATSENSTLPVSYADLREREASQPEDELQDTESDTESNPNPEEQLAPDFIPENCLFCGKANDTFEDSLAHMTSTHSFTVPYQDRLAVDLETVVAYLHLVIYGYHECICCATRRSTVEGVQQHMMAKGHCRYDMSLDLEEFYDTPESEYHAASSLVQSDQTSLRLPASTIKANCYCKLFKVTLTLDQSTRVQLGGYREKCRGRIDPSFSDLSAQYRRSTQPETPV
ncbi:hypothetical protein ACJ41O_013039 [Fusarium nematophilum]